MNKNQRTVYGQIENDHHQLIFKFDLILLQDEIRKSGIIYYSSVIT